MSFKISEVAPLTLHNPLLTQITFQSYCASKGRMPETKEKDLTAQEGGEKTTLKRTQSYLPLAWFVLLLSRGDANLPRLCCLRGWPS